MSAKNLVLFTHNYPYGKKESHIEKEINYLAKAFDKIYIFPENCKEEFIRVTPKNVKIGDIFHKSNPRNINSKLFEKGLAKRIFFENLYHSPQLAAHYIKHYSYYNNYLLTGFSMAFAIENWIQEMEIKNAIFYSYWFDIRALAMSILKRCQIIKHVYSRSHGFDLYDERWERGHLPFRNFQVKYHNLVMTDSIQGTSYFKTKVPEKFWKRIGPSVVGVDDFGENPNKCDAKIFRIISCSNLIPLKRVHLIVGALNKLNLEVEWIHFGDGSEMPRIQKLVRDLPPNIKWNLKGHVKNKEVIQHYQAQRIDLFLHLSETEGLPVSMMEAISFGVPILACNVGGISEIVTPQTGVLLNKDISLNNIADAIKKMAGIMSFDRKKIRQFYLDNYNASKNLIDFIGLLKNDKGFYG